MPISQNAGAACGVNVKWITAIIAIEYGDDPNAGIKSDSIGLMQIIYASAGRGVERHMVGIGEPTTRELKKPERNISKGGA